MQSNSIETHLSEAVAMLYSSYRNTDYPEHYIQSSVPLAALLYAYPSHEVTPPPARSFAMPRRRSRLRSIFRAVRSSLRAARLDDFQDYLHFQMIVHELVRDAMVELREQKKPPEEIVAIVSSTMAGYLQKFRDQETPEEREATKAEMARLYSSLNPPQSPQELA